MGTATQVFNKYRLLKTIKSLFSDLGHSAVRARLIQGQRRRRCYSTVTPRSHYRSIRASIQLTFLLRFLVEAFKILGIANFPIYLDLQLEMKATPFQIYKAIFKHMSHVKIALVVTIKVWACGVSAKYLISISHLR